MRELEQNMPANEIVVSVLGICYNHAKTLRRALDSVVCQQTSFAFELLVHDDASTDGSADVIREYAERYPAIVRPFLESENQYGKGRSVITEMAAQARGRYVALLETDDCWCDSSKLERQVHALDEHPECAFSVHDPLTAIRTPCSRPCLSTRASSARTNGSVGSSMRADGCSRTAAC